MDKSDVMSHVIDAVKQVQESSGRTSAGIGSGTRPFRDVEGFDSLSGVEATALLSQSLGQELPDSVFTPVEGSHTSFPERDSRKRMQIHGLLGAPIEVNDPEFHTSRNSESSEIG